MKICLIKICQLHSTNNLINKIMIWHICVGIIPSGRFQAWYPKKRAIALEKDGVNPYPLVK